MIRNETGRINLYCRKAATSEEYVQRFKTRLTLRGYPPSFIETAISTVPPKRHTEDPTGDHSVYPPTPPCHINQGVI
ncbi:hypothetical protein EON65_01655 [archaeon]|nr:MAG: hypothetical protein EON65_01655 [archaeon]